MLSGFLISQQQYLKCIFCFYSAVPSSVENINYKNISSSSILLYWDIPINPNGKIIYYTVYAMELDTNYVFHRTTSNNSILITGGDSLKLLIVIIMKSVLDGDLDEAVSIFP